MTTDVGPRFSLDYFRKLPEELRKEIISSLDAGELLDLYYDYEFRARDKQLFPKGDWFLWLLLSGRGFGKTFVGANWIIKQARAAVGPALGIIAPTAADLRDIAIEGPSGILASSHPSFRPHHSKSIGQLTFPNGVKVLTFSAEDPEQIRGFNAAGIWIDEAAVFRELQLTFELAQMANRLGQNPQFVITTTPKPTKMIRKWVELSGSDPKKYVLTTGSTYENKDNLAPSFIEQISMYEGTDLGRQEIYGEVLDLESSAIIQRSWFKLWPAGKKLPHFEYIIQSYDTAFTEKTVNNKTAQVTFAVFREGSKRKVLIIDCWDQHLNYPDLRKKSEDEYYAVYGPDQKKQTDNIIIEAKGSGISLHQDLHRIGLPTFSYNPGREDKVQRLTYVSHLVKKGLVYLLESEKTKERPRSWYKPFLDEVCSFIAPGKEVEDDYVDAFSQGLKYLRDTQWIVMDDFQEEEETPKQAKVNPYAA